MLDVCPMCGHGKKYVPTHIATMDEINRQVFATRHSPERHNEMREALEICRKFAEAMELAMTKPHPVTGMVNFIAECKADAARHLEHEIAALAEQAAPVKEGVK